MVDRPPEQAAALSEEQPAPQTDVHGEMGKRDARAARRARKEQRAATEDVEETGQPSLGALNRHLNQVLQQLATAHQMIGRVAAERDALRQQLADLQGIPVEEVEVTTLGPAPETPARG